MPLTVIVRSGDAEDARLTFDGTQRVVIGRSASSDVRLPDTSVSHRHATLRASGADFVLVDEGSTNGTFVGRERIPPHTSRLVRSGDEVRVGRLRLVLQIDQGPVTRDVAGATRELALALVARAMEAGGLDRSPRVRVLEGPDAGAVLPLTEEGREYLLGRAAHCDLALADPDVSREHARVTRRSASVALRDLGAKNGTLVAGNRVETTLEVEWRSAQTAKVGQTLLVLDEAVGLALAECEGAPDEVLGAPAAGLPPVPAPISASPLAEGPSSVGKPTRSAVGPRRPARAKVRWTAIDVVVMTTALAVLVASLLGLLWLLHR
ncbi:MAG: FHA domain-containing protein [Polyangiaceae bacterium]|nr:FHA domain-containing protein [Polyangiaceae bacterium]